MVLQLQKLLLKQPKELAILTNEKVFCRFRKDFLHSMKEKKIRILIVEDEQKLAQSIQIQLRRAGYDTDISSDGLEAEEKLKQKKYFLIILDLNLPNKSGIEFLRDLRKNLIKIPVIILSARDKVQDRINGLQIGADDYMVKPFDIGELLARIEAIVRRSISEKPAELEVDNLKMDLVNHVVTRGNKQIILTPREFTLLEFLMRNKNQIITRKRIAEQVWGYTFDTGTNIIDVYISYLRKAIDDGFKKKLLHTEYGIGFSLKDK